MNIKMTRESIVRIATKNWVSVLSFFVTLFAVGNFFSTFSMRSIGIVFSLLYALFAFMSWNSKKNHLKYMFAILSFLILFFIQSYMRMDLPTLLGILYSSLFMYSFLLPNPFYNMIFGAVYVSIILAHFGEVSRQMIVANVWGVILHAGLYILLAWLFKALMRERNNVKESEERYRKLIEHSPEMISVIMADGKVAYINPFGVKTLGAKDTSDIIGRKAIELMAPEQHDFIMSKVQKMLTTGNKISLSEMIVKRVDGKEIYAEITCLPIIYEGKIAILCVSKDVTDRKIAEEQHRKAEEQIEYLAFHDTLTGLPNRRMFEDRLNQALTYAKNTNEKFAVIFLDIDRFKLINDSLGHDIGDQLLIAVAARIQSCVRESDLVSRQGGDEFTILLLHVNNEQAILSIIQKIRNAIVEPFLLNGNTIHITCSLGISAYPNDGQEVMTLLKHADTAMYRAKDRGRNNYEFYTSDWNEEFARKVTLEQEL